MRVGWRRPFEAISTSLILTVRRNRDNVIDTMAQRKLRNDDGVSGAELARLVLRNTHKIMTRVSPG